MPSQMASLAALVSLLLLPSFVIAQIDSPDCSLTWGWTFNSLGQNACTVAAYLMATCYGGAFSIASLVPGYEYQGPSATDTGSQCKCTTVAYSLISACDACQGANWISWSTYMAHCSVAQDPSTFPHTVPSGTRVPAWALLDITAYPNKTWDSSKAFAVGDTPELAPGAAISSTSSSNSSGTTGSSAAPQPSFTSPYSASPSPSSASASSSSSTSHSSNVGAIAGGAAGGVAAISIVGLAVFFYIRRRRPEEPSYAPTASDSPQQPYMGEAGQPMTDDGFTSPSPSTPVTSMRLYNPNDPTTYPGYQPSAETLVSSGQVPISPHTGGGNTLANMQTAHGYHGLPTV